jgi:hypothetical protein
MLSIEDCAIRLSTRPCPVLKHLSITRLYMKAYEQVWADVFETLPNLELFSLCDVVLHTTDSRPISLPTLRELRLFRVKLTPDRPRFDAPRAIFSINFHNDNVGCGKGHRKPYM